jgi:hypothetical protein
MMRRHHYDVSNIVVNKLTTGKQGGKGTNK